MSEWREVGRETEREAWLAVGKRIVQAAMDVALEFGGKELMLEMEASLNENLEQTLLPNPKVIERLNDYHPDAAKMVLDRMEELQALDHEIERKTL